MPGRQTAPTTPTTTASAEPTAAREATESPARSKASKRRTSKGKAPVAAGAPTELNLAVALGTVGSAPTLRALPSGSTLLSLSLAVRPIEGPSTSLPVVWFDPSAKASELAEGEFVLVVGRMARRFFKAGGATQSRTELVAERIEPIRRKAACRRMLNGVEAHIEATIAEGFL